MAEDLDDGEFWLPSRFLSDEMGFLENKLPCEFPYADSSPVDSVVSSTETESDEEHYMAGLTRRMAHSTLEDDENDAVQKVGAVAGSPKSTLCTVGSWSGRSLDSNGSRGGSNGPSQVSSPPSTPLNQKDDAWGVLYAAAGQVVRMKMNDEGGRYHGRGLLGPPKKPVPAVVGNPVAQMKTVNGSGYPLQRCLSDNNRPSAALAMHFELLKQQQSLGRQGKIAQTQPTQIRARAVANAKFGRPLGLPSSAWPPLQDNTTHNGMTAGFLGNSGSRRESSGTGVFLPRRIGNPSDFRKKSGCSTVLLPARVVQALNLNIDDMGVAQPTYYLASLGHDHDNSINMDPRPIVARKGFLPPQRRPTRPQQPAICSEFHLPQEWTY